jgi:hypothetical protein
MLYINDIMLLIKVKALDAKLPELGAHKIFAGIMLHQNPHRRT